VLGGALLRCLPVCGGGGTAEAPRQAPQPAAPPPAAVVSGCGRQSQGNAPPISARPCSGEYEGALGRAERRPYRGGRPGLPGVDPDQLQPGRPLTRKPGHDLPADRKSRPRRCPSSNRAVRLNPQQPVFSEPAGHHLSAARAVRGRRAPRPTKRPSRSIPVTPAPYLNLGILFDLYFWNSKHAPRVLRSVPCADSGGAMIRWSNGSADIKNRSQQGGKLSRRGAAMNQRKSYVLAAIATAAAAECGGEPCRRPGPRSIAPRSSAKPRSLPKVLYNRCPGRSRFAGDLFGGPPARKACSMRALAAGRFGTCSGGRCAI